MRAVGVARVVVFGQGFSSTAGAVQKTKFWGAFVNIRIACAAAALLISSVVSAQALTLTFGESSPLYHSDHTGASAEIVLSFLEGPGFSDLVFIDVQVKNTTGKESFGWGATRSAIMSFGLDLADGRAATLTKDASAAGGFDFLFGTAQFFGVFPDNPTLDIGFAVGGDPDFGGDPTQGLQSGGPVGYFGATVITPLTASEYADAMTEGFLDGTLRAAMRFDAIDGDADYIGVAEERLAGVVASDVAPVPLPAAAWMLLAGLSAMPILRRRRDTGSDCLKL